MEASHDDVHPGGGGGGGTIAVHSLSHILSNKEEKQALQRADLDGDGHIGVAEFKNFLREHRSQGESLALARKIVAALSVALLVFVGINAALTFVIVDMAKDTKVNSNQAVGGIFTDNDGVAAKTGDPFLKLDKHTTHTKNNTLVEGANGGRRLLEVSEVSGFTELTQYYAYQKGEYLDKLLTIQKTYIVAACHSLQTLGKTSTLVSLAGDTGSLSFTSLDCENLQATGSLSGSRNNGKVGVVYCPSKDANSQCDVYEVLEPESAGRRQLLRAACVESLETPGMHRCGCFPGSSTVDVRGRGTVVLEHLRLGDEVLAVGPSGELDYFPIYLFSHRDVDASMEYVNIETAAGVRIRISAEHLLPLAKQANDADDEDALSSGLWMPAGEAVSGDTVWFAEHGATHPTPSRVTQVTRTVERGVYNMHASPNMQIVVDGVVASEYGSRTFVGPGPERALRLARSAHKVLPCSTYAAVARALVFAARFTGILDVLDGQSDPSLLSFYPCEGGRE